MFSKNLILSLIDKVTTGVQWLALFIWNIGPVIVCDVNSYTTESAFGSTVLNVLDTSVIILFLSHLNSSSISQLISDKSRDLQK